MVGFPILIQLLGETSPDLETSLETAQDTMATPPWARASPAPPSATGLPGGGGFVASDPTRGQDPGAYPNLVPSTHEEALGRTIRV